MSQTKFKQLLDTLSYPVYFHFVPQNKSLPCMSFIRVTPVFTRELSGVKTQNYIVWRVTLVAKTMSELEQLENSLQTLDNTGNADYQRIQVLPSNDAITDSESTFFSTIVDVRTYI